MNISKMTLAVLRDWQITESALAERVGCSQPTINRIKAGIQQPSYELGAAIRLLYERRPTDERAA